jgi:hypothetical protein
MLIPYFFWSILWLLIVLLLQSLPFAAIFIRGQSIYSLNLFHLLYRIIFDPIPYQLWFIREIIYLVLLSPLIYFLLLYMKYGILILLLLDWFWFGYLSHFFHIHNTTVFFFFIGGFFALYDNFRITPAKRMIYFLIFL